MTQTETKEVAGFETTQRTELEKIYKWFFELGAAASSSFISTVQGLEVPVSNSISVSISC